MSIISVRLTNSLAWRRKKTIITALLELCLGELVL